MADSTRALIDGLRDTYLLERSLGDGGMSNVWLAQDVKHQRPVALKVLKPELAKNVGSERFRREITTAARLQHPHILPVHDSGETAGLFWFTMPFVEGQSVRERLVRERRLPIDEAIRIVREASQALQYAHEHGIVHRDIKPENLLLTKDGSTLVADFGLARIVGSEAAGTAQLTQVGTAVGTPAYMSPEQATGDDNVDARADQYALAVTLYEMLTGEAPWSGATTAALMAQRFTEAPPSAKAKRPEVPADLDQALQRAMAVKAADRFGTVQEFAQALTGAADASARRARTVQLALMTVGVLGLLGLGALFLLRRGGETSAAPSDVTRLAVLPFENLGDTANAYFADGLSDELRGKLTGLPGLQVIARASSVQYRGTTKPPQEIAKELGVRYLLTGTVRWEKAADGNQGRVRVSPELIEVAPGGAPASKWQQPFDAPLTDVFQVQSGIASQVATALDVALGASAQRSLASRPTKDLQAYDAFLRGEAAWGNGNNTGTVETIRRAQVLYEEAVRRDSTFALAWARLAQVHTMLYRLIAPTPEDAAAAKQAVARAVALAPDEPATAIARAVYERNVERNVEAAMGTLRAQLPRSPNDAELLGALGTMERVTGDTLNARRHLVQAQALDPRSAIASARLAQLLVRLRDYPAAQASAERGYALGQDVSNLHDMVLVALAEGDLARARTLLADGDAHFGQAVVGAYVSTYFDTYWALSPEDQRAVTALRPDRFGGVRTTWALVLAQVHHLLGNAALTKAYADSARLAYEQQLQRAPDDPQANVLHGLALAYLGRPTEAIAAGERGVGLAPIAKDLQSGPYYQHQLVRIYLLAGDKAKALDLLEPLLKVPYNLSPGWLRIDPTFDPLRGDPRFEGLVAGR